jgi:glutamate-1-semialdehyde 2,1-aminomutase
VSGQRDQELRARAAKVMPSSAFGHVGTALLPANYPQFFERAEGAYVWDADGNRYLDYMCAFGPNLLGYRDPRVQSAASAQAARGDVMTGPSPLAVELAEKFVEIVSHADWTFFCKNGTDATTIARTIARAQTGRRKILIAEGSYHGAAPWCNPFPAGTVPEDRAHMLTFTFNDIASLEAAVAEAGDDLAGIIATPFKHEAFANQEFPTQDYARRCREICDASGAVLVVDDVRAGFRLAVDCSWATVGVKPDLSCWGKCFANGYSISAVMGSNRVKQGADSIFATGSFWQSAISMAAALATLDIIRDGKVIEKTVRLGQRLRDGLDEVSRRHGFTLNQTGPVQMPQILFEGDPDFRIGFAWTSAMIDRGFYLHPWHNMFLCDAMTEEDIDQTIEAADSAFATVRAALPTLQPHERVLALFSARAH